MTTFCYYLVSDPSHLYLCIYLIPAKPCVHCVFISMSSGWVVFVLSLCVYVF